MYAMVLSLHNIIRWVALILGILAVVRVFGGWVGKREWTASDRKVGFNFTMAMDLQFVLGLVLYFFLSPKTLSTFQDFGAALQVSDLRFFALEHPLIMILAVVFAHLGSIFSRRAEESSEKFRRASIWYSLPVLLLFLGIPWSSRLFPGF